MMLQNLAIAVLFGLVACLLVDRAMRPVTVSVSATAPIVNMMPPAPQPIARLYGESTAPVRLIIAPERAVGRLLHEERNMERYLAAFARQNGVVYVVTAREGVLGGIS